MEEQTWGVEEEAGVTRTEEWQRTKRGESKGLARGWKRAKRRELKGRTNAVRELDVIQSRSASPPSLSLSLSLGKKYCLSFADTFSIPFSLFFSLFVQGAKRHSQPPGLPSFSDAG